MGEFLIVEPSTDIHLVLDPTFTSSTGQPLSNLTLKVWIADLVNNNTGYLYANPVVQYDITQAHQQIVTVNNDVLTPVTKGTAFIQVRVTDPGDANFYHYVMLRVMVHNRMDAWWFGDESLRVFTDPLLPHSQPSIYASFDNGEVVGDITAHGYVTLTPDPPAPFTIANNMANPWSGRIRGVSRGLGLLTGNLLNTPQQLQIKVEDFVIPNNRILKRLKVDTSVSPRQKFNMLFVAEGFNNEAKFEKLCKEITHDLFSTSKNSPYNLLKDDFNVWTVFKASDEEGITIGSHLCQDGNTMPSYGPGDDNEQNGRYTTKRLTELVGFSDRTAMQRGINDANMKDVLPPEILNLKNTWKNEATAVALGIQEAKIPDTKEFYSTILRWMNQIPYQRIPQTKTTWYGFIAGNRPGEKHSDRKGRTEHHPNNPQEIIHQETWYIPTHADFRPHLYTARIRDWYKPNSHNVQFFPDLDNRRWAPEWYRNTLEIPLAERFRNYISQLEEFDMPIDSTFRVGEVWDKDIVPSRATRSYRSAGLVCFLINSPLTGRSQNYRDYFIGGIIGKRIGYKQTDRKFDGNNTAFREETDGHVRKLFVEPPVVVNREALLGMIAHEFGHSFNLGDEYESYPAIPDQQRIDRIDLFDNLVHHNHVAIASQETKKAKPIDPEKLPWSVLHRVKYAITIAEPATIVDKNTFEAVVTPADMKNLGRIVALHEKVYLHRYIANLDGQHNRLLRINPQDTLTKDIFQELEITSDLNPATRKITLKTTASSKPLEFPTTGPDDNFIAAGSYLYVPVRYENGDPRFLIEKPVMNFMKTHSYGGSAPNGRALSENFKDGSTWNGDYAAANLDPIDPEKKHNADNPASIPGFKGPCKKFRMIGAYEGGDEYVGYVYRPTGACKMRDAQDDFKYDSEKEYCFVCKYLIVSRVNPSKLGALENQYPESKEEKWKQINEPLVQLQSWKTSV